jgi:TPR repeat protein
MLQSPMQKILKFIMIFIVLFGVAYGAQMSQQDFEATKIKCEVDNDGAACSQLYYYYISSKRSFVKDLAMNKKRALYYAKKACKLDDADGCFTAGMTLYYGDQHTGIAVDKVEGRKLLKKACELGKEDICSYFLNPNF